jgi:hypothetical protein
MSSDRPSEDVTFVAHPPERGRRSTTLLSPGCCCCCCCCFHSLGSLAGALYGMSGGRRPLTPGISVEEAIREEKERKAADKYAIKLYWWSLLIVAVLTTLITITEDTGRGAGAVGMAGLVIAIFLPLGQLGASVLALIYINVFPPSRKPECLRRLGRITLLSFIWGMIGAALTWILLLGLK